MKFTLLLLVIRSVRDMVENHSVERITLPTLKYGYRVKKLQWDELQDILPNGDIARLSRSVEQQRDYEIYKQELLKTWNSVLDHILVSKLGYEMEERGNKLHAAKPPTSEVMTKVVLNDFPYYVEDHIEHWVLWKLNESINDKDIDKAKEYINTQRTIVDFLHWINPPHLQSLPEIEHVHILCKLQD